MGLASKHKKRLWYTAAVGGVAGLTGLAGINYVARVAGPNQGSGTTAAAVAAPQVTRPMADAKNNKDKNKNSDSKGGKDATGDEGGSGSYDRVVKVPCDPDQLIQALVQANLDAGGTLKLAEDCTYTLTRSVHYDGLPPITQPITVLGNGATIQRAAGGSASAVPMAIGPIGSNLFRIWDVQVGGNLTLRDLTVKYGVGTGIGADSGGGGLLVRTGGRATVDDVTFAYNRSTGVGGAISNFGITKITGDDKHKDGVYKSDPKSDDTKDGTGSDLYGQWSQAPSSDDSGEGSGAGWNASDSDWRSSIVHNVAHDGIYTLGIGGGGIFNQRYLTVENTRIAYNTTEYGDGGGVETVLGGVTQMRYVSVDHNHAKNDGGGVHNGISSTTSLEYSSVSDNTSGDDGGGIKNEEKVAIKTVREMANLGMAPKGVAGQQVVVRKGITIFPAGSVFLNYVSLLHNFAYDEGGGIKNQGALVADYTRINENTASSTGGGLQNDDYGQAVLRNSEVNRNQTVDGNGAGIWNDALVNLTSTMVNENDADDFPAGGIQNNGKVNVDTHSSISKNVPTNCAPTSVTPAEACFN